MFCAVYGAVTSMPWWGPKPTELDEELWCLERRLRELIREISAIENNTGIEFDPKDVNYKSILDTVAVENDLCKGANCYDPKLRSFNLEIIRGHYLQKEIERLTKDYEDLRALRQSGGDYNGREKKLPPKKMQ